jgi:integrase/recombinase XerD
MKSLRSGIADYLELRRALGFKLDRDARLLPEFVTYLQGQGARHIMTRHAVSWACLPSNAKPNWRANRLALVRRFAKYMVGFDPRTEIPGDLLPRTSSRAAPYVYSNNEIESLIQSAHTLSGLKGATYATLFGLLAATGMRVGEAINLDRADIDWRSRLLIIRNSKFGKSRELVLHHSTLKALLAYACKRDRAVPKPRSPSFLLSLAGTRLFYQNVHCSFLSVLRHAGLYYKRPRRPRLHDLRHTYATRILESWYRKGLDVTARLPLLSTYLGHTLPSDTYWYLTATPELMRLAQRRLGRVMVDLP